MTANDAIRFYPQSDCYYFDFTPYSHLSVKIHARNYYTLNHYYQAQRAGRVDLVFKIYTATGVTDLAHYLLEDKAELSANEKQHIMMKGLEAKFDQHPYLREKLIATGNKQLVFYHTRDPFWGTGDIPKYGYNMLGELLMDLRSQLASQSPPTSLVNLQPPHQQSISNHVTIQSPPTSHVNLQPRHQQSISNHFTIQSPPTSLVNLQPPHQQSISNHVTSHNRPIFRIIEASTAQAPLTSYIILFQLFFNTIIIIIIYIFMK